MSVGVIVSWRERESEWMIDTASVGVDVSDSDWE